MIAARRTRAWLLAGVASLGVGGCAEPPAAEKAAAARPVIRLITGPMTGTLRVTGLSLQREYNRLPSGPTIEILISGGAIDNVQAIQSGEADLGLTYSDIAYSAFSGKLEQKPQKFDRLAAVALMQVTPFHIVVGRDSKIHSATDLRGARLGMGGAPGRSGSHVTAQLVLTILGVPLSAVTIEPGNPMTPDARLKSGAIDAYLHVGPDPIDWIQRAIGDGMRMVPLTDPQVQRLSEVYPYFRPTLIRKAAYTGLAQSIPTIGVDGLLVCRKDLDEQVVYDLAKGLFQALPALSSPDGSPFIDVEQAAATPIPLHPGASRYYRERQLSR